MSVWAVDDLGIIAQQVSWALFAVAAVTCGLRVYCRLRYSPRQGGGLYVDDFITLFCLLVLFVFCVLISAALPFGVGKHYNTLSEEDKIRALKWNAILSAITPWICTLPKFAIVTTLKRILNYGTKTTILFWGLALSSQATVFVMMVWGLVQCKPVAYQWDMSLGGWCADPSIYLNIAYVTYIYSTVLDVFFALYPVPFVMRLNMPLKVRIGVAISLSISWLGFVISVYKFTILPELGTLLVTDPSFPLVYLCMTHAVEGSFLIISTSFATLRPLFREARQQVASLPMMSRLTTKPQSTDAAKSVPRTGQSHVDVVEFALSTRQEKRDLQSAGAGSTRPLIEVCRCPRDVDGAITPADDGESGLCGTCGLHVSGGRTGLAAPGGLTWMEMIKT